MIDKCTNTVAYKFEALRQIQCSKSQELEAKTSITKNRHSKLSKTIMIVETRHTKGFASKHASGYLIMSIRRISIYTTSLASSFKKAVPKVIAKRSKDIPFTGKNISSFVAFG